MASVGYSQSESYPTFLVSVLPLPSFNGRAASFMPCLFPIRHALYHPTG